MIDFYIHQIGNIQNEKTYERLISILKSQTISSRDFLEKQEIKFENDNASFKLDIPENKKWMYYEEDIHKDRVSLSDPQNRFIKKSIEKKDHQMFTCFDYDYIAFAVSRDVPLVPQEETHGLAQYIVGLILPITEEQMQDEKNIQIVEAFASLCEKNEFPLDIYNYEGVLLDKKKQIKSI